jgi:hypothetical protein
MNILIRLFSLVLSLVVFYPCALATEGAAKKAVVNNEDYESLLKATDQAKKALNNIQPFKLTIMKKLEKLRAQGDADSASNRYLIDVNEAKLERIVLQERDLKKSLLTIEAQLNEMRQDPEIAAILDGEQQLKLAITQHEELLNSLPKLPDLKKQN